MYYFVKADLSRITPGASMLTVYDGTSKKMAELAASQVANWLKALNQHGAWLLLTEVYAHSGSSANLSEQSWEVRWNGPVNTFGNRDEFLLFQGHRDADGPKIVEWPAGKPTLTKMRDTIPAAWFEGFLSNDKHWLRHQRSLAA